MKIYKLLRIYLGLINFPHGIVVGEFNFWIILLLVNMN